MNLQEAGGAPRVFHDGITNYGGHFDGVGNTYLESGFGPVVIGNLQDKGLNIRMGKGIFGGYQAIM